MPTASVGRIDVPTVIPQRQPFERLLEQHRLMSRGSGHLRNALQSQRFEFLRQARFFAVVVCQPLLSPRVPPFFAPELELVALTDQHRLTVEARELSQLTRQKDP